MASVWRNLQTNDGGKRQERAGHRSIVCPAAVGGTDRAGERDGFAVGMVGDVIVFRQAVYVVSCRGIDECARFLREGGREDKAECAQYERPAVFHNVLLSFSGSGWIRNGCQGSSISGLPAAGYIYCSRCKIRAAGAGSAKA